MTVLARLVWERPYDPKLAARLHRIQCPTLLLWGDHDRLVPPAYGEAYRQHIPGSASEADPPVRPLADVRARNGICGNDHRFLQGCMMANVNWPPKVALITGAGSGLGRQLALQLAEQGVAIAGVDLKAEGLQTLEQELRAKKATMGWEVADVTDARALRNAVQSLEAKVGAVDLVIAMPALALKLPPSGLSRRYSRR